MKAMMHAMKVLFEKRLRRDIMKTIVVINNNRFVDCFDLSCTRGQRDLDGRYEE